MQTWMARTFARCCLHSSFALRDSSFWMAMYMLACHPYTSSLLESSHTTAMMMRSYSNGFEA